MADIEEGQSSNTNDTRITELKLYKAVLSNDWEKAKDIYENNRIKYGTTITDRGETALHIAALAGHTDFVQNLVEEMEEADTILAMEPRERNQEMGPTNTAFHFAAISGDVKSAKAIVTKPNLRFFATARGSGNCLPIYMAAVKGNKEMVRYLYKDTVSLLEAPNPAHDLKLHFKDLLTNLIKADIFDVALNMAKELLNRRISCEKWEEGALHQLAQKPLNSVGILEICFSPLLQRHVAEKRLMNICITDLVKWLWKSLISDEKKVQELIKRGDGNVILEAAKHGNFKFLSILIASYPDVLFSYDHNYYTIFHHAILHRHVEIFKLIRIGSVKTVVTTYHDKGGKNMLHLAGKLAPPNRLSIVRGAALQLQRELLWFEEVKKVMEPHEVNRKISSLYILQQSIKDMKKLIGRSDSGITQQLLKKLEKMQKASEVLVEQHDGALFLFEELKKVMEQYKSRVDNISAEDYTKLLLQLKEIETFMGQHEMMEECTPEQLCFPNVQACLSFDVEDKKLIQSFQSISLLCIKLPAACWWTS